MDLFKSAANTINKRIKSHNCYKSKIFIVSLLATASFRRLSRFRIQIQIYFLFFFVHHLFPILSTAFCDFFISIFFLGNKNQSRKTNRWIYSKVVYVIICRRMKLLGWNHAIEMNNWTIKKLHGFFLHVSYWVCYDRVGNELKPEQTYEMVKKKKKM